MEQSPQSPITLRTVLALLREAEVGSFAAQAAFFVLLSAMPFLVFLTAVIPHLPLTGAVPVTPGKGGTGKKLAGGASDGFAGGDTVFGNFRVPGGEGGGYSSAFVPTPATAGIFTASVGTAAAGAPSLLGAGGVSSAVGDGVPGGIGAGGGRTSASGCTSGAGGDGVVIVYGVPAEITEAEA